MTRIHLATLVLTGILLGAGLVLGTASVAQAAPTRTFILYGDALNGWGFTKTNVTSPGPTIVVNAGDTVSLELFSNDSAKHTWFIDYNNNSAADAGEPSSTPFQSATVPTWFNFTADPAHVGTWTYRCAIHPSVMKGLIVILPAANVVLYGSATAGWGFGPTNISNPGPTITVTPGQSVVFELVSEDGNTHTFFVDLNGNGAYDAGEPISPRFGGSGYPSVVSWTWIVNASPGNYTYYCSIHLTAMKGTIVVKSATSPGTGSTAPPSYALYAGIIIVVVVVAVGAVVAIRRRPKSPPAQPPMPPSEPPKQG